MQVDLVPGGADKDVTAENLVQYILLVMEHSLNEPGVNNSSKAFWDGFHDIIAPEWTNLFSCREVQALFNSNEGLDIADMKGHMEYDGGFHSTYPTIVAFWEV